MKQSTRQGNLDERCSDALVWELMLQAGPVGKLLTLLHISLGLKVCYSQ
jgi:hypothetical protein